MLLTLGKQGVYHANFRFGKGFNGEPAMWIGIRFKDIKMALIMLKQLQKDVWVSTKNFYYVPITPYCGPLCGSNRFTLYLDEGFYANTHLVRVVNRAKVAEAA